MKIIFTKGFTSPILDFQNGEYRRTFERTNQPFDVTDEEWKTLKRTGHFELEPVKETEQSQADNNQQSEDK